MNRTSGIQRTARIVAIVATALGLWGALVLLFSVPLALTRPASWRQAISFGASFWALWFLFMPAVALLSFRFPFERRRIVRNAALHLIACLLVVAAGLANSRIAEKILPRTLRIPLGPPGFRPALDVLVFWSLVGVCQAITNFRRSQERERRAAELEGRLASAQLQALRTQINPHFLFNTLNSIAALVYINPRAADEMLGDLSDLLRRSLDSIEEQEITLAQELEFIGAYLRIEQKRFGERLRLEQSIPDELMNALVPALILQPLVENAIRHGIEPQRDSGLISIEAKRNDQQLHLTVRNSGRGLPDADQANSAQRRLGNTVGHGIGLANTKARLQALYGPNHSFTFGKAAPRGCRVDIRLPFHSKPARLHSVSNPPTA